MRSPLLALALALAATLAASPSSAFFHITTTACDTVATDPLRVRTTFDVDLVGPGSYCWLIVQPLPAGPGPNDATIFYAAVAPVGWAGSHECATGCPALDFYPQDYSCFGTGSHFAGFQLIANRAGPCARISFGLSTMEGDTGAGCLVLDGPVPARAATWGGVKSLYRE